MLALSLVHWESRLGLGGGATRRRRGAAIGGAADNLGVSDLRISCPTKNNMVKNECEGESQIWREVER